MNPVHFNRRPENSPGSTYYCEDFDIKFTVHDEDFLVYRGDGVMDRYSNITGEIIVDEIKYEFYAFFSADYGMQFLSKEISSEGVVDVSSVHTVESKYCLVSAICEYKSNGVIIATVGDGALLKAGTELIFTKK